MRLKQQYEKMRKHDSWRDENFSQRVVELLRSFGHDVLTARTAGNAGFGIPDEEVLSFAVNSNRAVLTFNRRHFIRLHKYKPDHKGIIVCTEDSNRERLAARINEAIATAETLEGQLIRVNRPLQ